MGATVTSVRIDPKLKADAQAVFDGLGITLSAGISAFLKATVRENGMPFDMKLDISYDSRERDIARKVNTASWGNTNSSLNHAGIAKKDEFYTRLCDIEAELNNYPGAFRDKIVYCNCDDPLESNFFKFFVLHFNELKLKKLIATCHEQSVFHSSRCVYDSLLRLREANSELAFKAVVTEVEDDYVMSSAQTFDSKALFSMPGNSLEVLAENGDFRSAECRVLLNESDIVVTNPPFSLFREFMSLLITADKDFIVIGNINAITYKEIFPLIRDNQIWLGASIHSGDRMFYVPESYPLDAASCGIDDNGKRYIKVKGIRWFTNMDMRQRHQGLVLSKQYDPITYPVFDNYSAINVSRTANIPYDYPGVMGVPITFLDKYDPEQFEILMLANGNVRANSDSETLKVVGYRPDVNDKGGVGVIDGKRSYARILVRNKHPKPSKVGEQVEAQ